MTAGMSGGEGSRPRVLLTNDDGVRAPGLRAAFDALAPHADVTVVAPVDQRSGASHQITLESPLRAHRLSDLPGWMVDFTPVDCVKLALGQLLPVRPDLVVSGINRGSNAGNLAHYSGTVAAAKEAVLAGVPAVAFSLCGWDAPDFEAAARVVAALVPRVLARPLPPRTLLNVNVPRRPWAELKGLRWCRQSQRPLGDAYEERRDPRGAAYYWLSGEPVPARGAPDDDFEAIAEGWVAITPLTVDWTAEALWREGGEAWLDGLRGPPDGAPSGAPSGAVDRPPGRS